MILSFRDRRSEAFSTGAHVREFSGFARQAHKRLAILNAATALSDLRGLPSNRLEALHGDETGSSAFGSTASGVSASDGRRARPARSMSRSSTTIDEGSMSASPAIHPGEVLADELEVLAIEPSELARQINVTAARIAEVVGGHAPVTSDLALRLGHWFSTSPEFWLNLQTAYDLRLTQATLGPEIARLPTRPAA